MDGDSFTLVEAPQFTDDEVLTITVNNDPDGDNGLLITGTYTLKLKDVKVTENGQQKPLTAMKSGEHLTLTVTLQHNMLVQATATIGGWDEVRADVDLNQDPSKMPPYEYDATTKTYTVYEVKDGQITIKGKQYPIKLADGFYIIRKLTVSECKRLQTVPEWYEFPVSDTQAYKMLGNGWTVEVIVHLIKATQEAELPDLFGMAVMS
jgi:site-specific DNA-cytosine methylase